MLTPTDRAILDGCGRREYLKNLDTGEYLHNGTVVGPVTRGRLADLQCDGALTFSDGPETHLVLLIPTSLAGTVTG